MIPCGVCGMKFDCSPRAFRYYQSGARQPRCMIHRQGPRERPESKTAAFRREMLNRYTVAEIFVMGRAIEMTLTGRRLPVPPALREQVTQVEAEWLALSASADAA